MTSFQRRQYGNREERVSSQRRNLTPTTSARWPRSSSTVINKSWLSPWNDVMEMAPACVVFLSQPINQSTHEKNIKQVPTEEHPTIRMTHTPQNSQGHQKQRPSEKLSQWEEPKETWQLSVTGNPSWAGDRKRASVKRKNLDKLRTVVINNEPLLIH